MYKRFTPFVLKLSSSFLFHRQFHCTRTMSTAQRFHFILDWDGTVTQKDTLDALIDICKTIKPAAEVSSTWNHLTQAYLSDYEAAIRHNAPNNQLPRSVPKERELLLELEAVEQRSIDRVSSSKIFQGLTLQLIQDGARNALANKHVQFRRGYIDFENHLDRNNSHVGAHNDTRSFLSVNWSRYFISSCLQVHSIVPTNLGQIYANELQDLGTNTGSTGIIIPADANPSGIIISSNGKLRALKNIRDSHRPAKVIVYVGDSWTDFEALLEADVGICIRDDPITSTQRKLADAFNRCRINCPHISEINTITTTKEGWNVVWARNFEEIERWRVGVGDSG